jgi:hypothetical protein
MRASSSALVASSKRSEPAPKMNGDEAEPDLGLELEKKRRDNARA